MQGKGHDFWVGFYKNVKILVAVGVNVSHRENFSCLEDLKWRLN